MEESCKNIAAIANRSEPSRLRLWMRCCFGYIKTPLTTTSGPPSLSGLMKVKLPPTPSPTVSLQATFQRFIFELAFVSLNPLHLFSFSIVLQLSFYLLFCQTEQEKEMEQLFVDKCPVSRPDCTATRAMCVRHMSKKTEVCFYPPLTAFSASKLCDAFSQNKNKNCIYNKVIKQHDNSVVSNLPALSAIHHVTKVPKFCLP